MSGVAGADRIRSRKDFQQFMTSYFYLIKQFSEPYYMAPTGSYNSDLDKETFGDMDLVVCFRTKLTKTTLKKSLVEFFNNQPVDVIIPFSNPKYLDRRTYNSGEIVTVRYYDSKLGYSAQIDNIIATSGEEADFKIKFLNLTAPMQGLILGLVKVATLENPIEELFIRLQLPFGPDKLGPDEEYEFNLSSSELQLRRVRYAAGTFNQISREIIWTSTHFTHVLYLLSGYHITDNFENFVSEIKTKIKNPRSFARIKGLFRSMISVKSGEIGTPKGADKERAIQLIQEHLTVI